MSLYLALIFQIIFQIDRISPICAVVRHQNKIRHQFVSTQCLDAWTTLEISSNWSWLKFLIILAPLTGLISNPSIRAGAEPRTGQYSMLGEAYGMVAGAIAASACPPPLMYL